ncbi:MAG: flagellar M-ring protein FliF [Neomegalonema sp.]|nr:flagellar M-ring protein FliF [Neomegalonema sp.]
MQALADTWSKLSIPRRLVLVGAVLATLFTVFLIARTATQPRMALLFGGLQDKAAGEIVAALEQMGVPHEVRGSSVYVPVEQQSRLRVKLAGEGLIKASGTGYELLDGMTGFGTTQAMFRTAVKRATEGELKRTIEAMPDVHTARVMIAMGKREPFSREKVKTTAAVQVRSIGGRLKPSSAASIRYLVALAVPGLEPEQVVVSDTRYGIILKPGDKRTGEAGEEREERIAARMREKLEKLLVANVGEGAFRVEVTVETTRETSKTSEVILDPNSQVPVKSDSTEVKETATTPSSPVTVASNLPDGDAKKGDPGKSDKSTARETVSYRYSETKRDKLVEPGAIKRIGVGIVLDMRKNVGTDGKVTRVPRTEEELKTIEQIVKSAIIFDEARGDTVRVKSLAFVDPETLDAPLEASSAFDKFLSENGGRLAQLLVLGLVALLLGLMVVKPILTSRAQAAADEMMVIEGSLADAVDDDAVEDAELVGADGELSTATAAAPGEAGDTALATTPAAALPDGVAPTPALSAPAVEAAPMLQNLTLTQAEQLREIARNKSDEALVVLKRWLTAKSGEEEAGRSA